MENKEQNVILDSISEAVFTVDLDWRITSFNRAAEEITGISRQEAVGKHCRDILRADVCETNCTLAETIQTGRPITNKAVHIIDADGKRRTIAISTALLKDPKGKVIGGVETFRDTSAIEQLRKEIEGRYSFEDIVSQSHIMQSLFAVLPNIAESNTTILIEGQSGTGKELFARAIHNLGFRRDKPFIAVNCGALPDTLLESELFGYKAGAFTDARKDKPGRFALAEGGTIFLDEIGDISASVQVKLLRVLQEKTYEPIGAVSTVKADVRIITATNKKLDRLVEEGKFRDDLYYRVNVMKLELPSLRQRKEDVPLLVEHFISKFNQLHNKNICCVTNEAATALLAYDYPGNVRELENIIEHCFVLCQDEIIEAKHLPSSVCPALKNGDAVSSEPATIKQMEIVLITQALRRNKGNKTATARELGIDKSTLFRKIKAFDITDKTS
ncbi:MAG: sigma 54-interacting transcriptional regulator [Anaerohalosphaeraceae bacterium]|nr:sigma 54-interacting transcriptional regulator [Anaerohalosphaeraceae bacterium]